MTSGYADMQTVASSPFKRAKIHLQPINGSADDVQTVPQLIEYNARHNPDHLICIQALKQEASAPQQFHSVSHLQLAQAILGCSEWLVKNVRELRLPWKGDDGRFAKGPPVALFMESDVGLLIHTFSLMSLGVPVLAS